VSRKLRDTSLSIPPPFLSPYTICGYHVKLLEISLLCETFFVGACGHEIVSVFLKYLLSKIQNLYSINFSLILGDFSLNSIPSISPIIGNQFLYASLIFPYWIFPFARHTF
jgi:hypothetical protein